MPPVFRSRFGTSDAASLRLCVCQLRTLHLNNIRDMRNPGFVYNSGLPEERSWPHACACFPTYEPTLGPNPRVIDSMDSAHMSQQSCVKFMKHVF